MLHGNGRRRIQGAGALGKQAGQAGRQNENAGKQSKMTGNEKQARDK